ncbi:unnamed protein product [Peniophora sp. CBMAI 1063]|nr:unnamed protein product [Peniophora sp. CBMAI 1063]
MSVHQPVVRHATLKTTFIGIQHAVSTSDAPVNQFRGIKYASLPGRFRQSHLFVQYHSRTDATRYGPVCPQPRGPRIEQEVFGFDEDEFPVQNLKQIESECLNLNITVPAGATPHSRLPVLVWVHGGGPRGSGSHWLFDGGALVQSSILLGKPIVLVTFNYRLGILGSAAGAALAESNAALGDEPGANFALRDQYRALEWVNNFIGDFGGDPESVTLAGQASGAADVLCHVVSRHSHLFARAIVQSPTFETAIPSSSQAGAHLRRTMSACGVHSIDELRRVDAEKLVIHIPPHRTVDDGLWFREGWKELLGFADPAHGHRHFVHAHPVQDTSCPVLAERVLAEINGTPSAASASSPGKKTHASLSVPREKSRSRSPAKRLAHLPPVIIGDCGFEAYMYAEPISQWSSNAVDRRVKVLAQNLHRATDLLRAYDATAQVPEDELPDRLLELVNDARFSWPTHRVASALKAAGTPLWRYVFDQEAPKRGVPHHATDLLYLFDTSRPSDDPDTMVDEVDLYPDHFSDSDSSTESGFDNSAFANAEGDDTWATPVVDSRTYNRVRDAMQNRWLGFIYGEQPWAPERVCVFGPEGEVGERSQDIFAARRRVGIWADVMAPLGRDVVLKIGVELSNGPAGWKS